MTTPGGRHRRFSLRSGTFAALATATLTATLLLAAPSALADTATDATTYSFESDEVGSVPAGCTTPAGRAAATVSNQHAYDGSHSLEVHDTSASTVVVATCQDFAQQGAEMSVEIYPVNALGLMIDVDGRTQRPISVDNGAVFHLRVNPNGALSWYDGRTWQPMAGAGTVPNNQWTRVQVVVPIDNSAAYVAVNGVDLPTTAGPAGGANNPITEITGFGFGSLGASANGDDGFVDDVTFGPVPDVPRPPGAPTTGSFTPGVLDGFESDTVGSAPSGCGTPPGSLTPTVSDQQAHQGNHSVQVTDTNPLAQAQLICETPAQQQGAYLSFNVDPVTLNALAVDITGTALVGAGLPDNAVFHLKIGSDGSISWDQLSAWYQLAPAGTIPIGQWSHVQLSVPADNQAVHVTVDGNYVGSGGSAIGDNSFSPSSYYDEVTAVTGFAFASAGLMGVGDDVFVDDVTFGPAADIPADAVGTAPFQVGPTSTVDTGGSVQAPNAGVVVPNGDGHRILVTYSNRMAYSDDGGATWKQTDDPMPTAAGVQLTKLRNGDLLAVDFHTYMVADSDNTQAEVDTAISHDNGATWTQHIGLMTAPQEMRSIGASGRPGIPLGGFALVHPVVEDPDGTLYQSAYGYYTVDQKYRQILLVSDDEGVNWTVKSTVAVATTDPAMLSNGYYDGPCEGAFARTADGSLLMIIRNGWWMPMTYSRSIDNGATWSAPQQVQVGPSRQALLSIFPTLELTPTGELVLLTGRPGQMLTMSKDGLGDDWSTPVGVDYTNSENGGFMVLDPTSVMVVGDRGRYTTFEVWSRRVTIDQPCAQTVTGVHDGPLSAGAGGLCLVNATVNGAVSVTGGGRLIVQGSTIHGPVSTSGASVVSLCGSNVQGSVTLTGTTGNVAVGDTVSGCDATTIVGPLRVAGTAGHVVVDRAALTGPVAITGNSAALATVLAGLTVHGPLSCSDNAVTPTDSDVANTVDGPSTGQCAALT